MTLVRLTKRTIETLPHPESGQILYRDPSLPGFGLRVGSRSKVFFVEGQVARRTVRVSIGRADVLAPEFARRKAQALLGEMAEGRNPNAEKRKALAESITVAEAFDAFFAAKPQLSPVTLENYGRTPRLYLGDWVKQPINKITRQMVLTRHQKISRERGEVTANNVMRHFRSIYNFVAAAHDEFPPNPVSILTQARAWHRERRRRSIIASHQLPAWWEAVMKESDYARDFLLVALFTGMRRSEIATLQWDNLDLTGRALHLPRTKNGDSLDLPISDFLSDVFTVRRKATRNAKWVFPGKGETGHLVETKSFTARVEEASGVSFSLHDLRRTFVTIAESLDIPAYALKRLLNHRADSDVTGGYIVINVERLREPVERVSTRILELCDAEAAGNYHFARNRPLPGHANSDNH